MKLFRLQSGLLIIILLFVSSDYIPSSNGQSPEQIWAVKWSNNSQLIATGDNQGNVRVVDYQSNEIINSITIEDAEIVELEWATEDKSLAIATEDTRILFWDLGRNEVQVEIAQLPSPGFVSDLTWTTNGRNIVIGQQQGNPNYIVWDLEEQKSILEETVPSISELALSPDDSILAMSYMIPHIELIDPINFEQQGFIGEPLDALRTRFIVNPVQNAILLIDWKPDGKSIVSGSVDGIVTLWDVDSGEIVFEYNLSPDEVDFATAQLRFFRDVWFSVSGNTFSGIQADGAYHIWDSETGTELANFELNSHDALAEISPNKTQLAYVDDENELHIVAVYDLVVEQANSKITQCTSDESLQVRLSDLMEDEPLAFINELEANRDSFELEICADELIGLATALQDIMLGNLSTRPSSTAVPTDNNFADLIDSVQEKILTLPEACNTECFWSFKLGEHTFDDFKVFLLATFPTAKKEYSDDRFPLTGYSLNGITVQANYGIMDNVSDVVEVLGLNITPSLLGSLTVDYSDYLPDSIIDEFGQPDEVHFIYNPENPRTSQQYNLFMVFSDRLTVYETEGNIHAENACLTTEGIETISIHRYATLEKLQEFFHNSETSHFASMSPDELIDDGEGMCISLKQTND